MRRSLLFVLLLLVAGLLVPGAAALNVVTTMPNVYDCVNEVGGDHVTAIYIQPAAGVHLSPDVIDGLLQTNSEFIKTADAFIAQKGMDTAGINKVNEFASANFDFTPDWKYIGDRKIPLEYSLGTGSNVYNDPENLKQYAAVVCSYLIDLDSANQSSYLSNWEAYCSKIDTVTAFTPEEEDTLAGTPVIRHKYMEEQTVTWMNMETVDSFTSTESSGDIVDKINADPDKYRKIARESEAGRIFVVENGVAGPENGKLIYEALQDNKIPSARVIFQNLPKMAAGVDTNLDFYLYNKNLIFNEIKNGYPTVNIVATMANVGDVTRQIGGKYVKVIMGPGEAVHQSAETLNAWMQTNSEFIFTADAFFAQDTGDGMDHNAVSYLTEFRQKNKGLSTDWKVIEAVTAEQAGTEVTNDYDHPEALKKYSAAVCYLLKAVDPQHAEQYEENLETYLNRIDSETTLTAGELNALEGTPVICMYYLQAQTHDWMQMDVLKAYYPSPTAVGAVVQDIIDNTQTYRDAANESATGKIFVIDNALCPNPKAGVPIHEKLIELEIPAERVVFQNMPGMIAGLNTMMDYYLYNKHLILPLVQYDSSEDSASASSTSSAAAPGTFTFANALTVELTPAAAALPAGTKLTLGEVPENLPATGLDVQRTMEIHLENAQSADVSGATFEFGVPTGIISAAGYGQYDIIMLRLVNDVWTELPTTFSYEANGMTYYTAETPGFSVFAVAYKKGATAEAVPKTDTEGPELKPVDTTATATAPTTAVPATTAPATASPTQTKAPAPLFGILAGLAAAAVLLPRIR